MNLLAIIKIYIIIILLIVYLLTLAVVFQLLMRYHFISGILEPKQYRELCDCIF